MSSMDTVLLNSKGPWWIKTLWVAGPVTIIALGLVWFITQNIDRGMKELNISVDSIRENFILHHQESEILNRNIAEYMKIQILLTQQLCVNAATDSDQRAACFKR